MSNGAKNNVWVYVPLWRGRGDSPSVLCLAAVSLLCSLSGFNLFQSGGGLL